MSQKVQRSVLFFFFVCCLTLSNWIGQASDEEDHFAAVFADEEE